MTKRELLARVCEIEGVRDVEDAEHVVTAVFQALRDRLTPNEAEDVEAQLPTSWKELWESGAWWEKVSSRLRGLNKLDREEFLRRVQMHIRNEVAAEDAVRTIFRALKEQISAGEADDVSSQLPEDLRHLWRAA